MKHMKKVVALLLVIMSVCTFVLSASASTKWVSASPSAVMQDTPGGDIVDRMAYDLPVYEYYITVYLGSLWSFINFDGSTGYVQTSSLTTTSSGYSTPQNLRQAFGYYLLRNGSSGFRVKNLQKALFNGKYYTGAIDGVFGNATETAVRNYQTAEGLTVDGLVGDNTKSHLWTDFETVLMTSGYVQ